MVVVHEVSQRSDGVRLKTHNKNLTFPSEPSNKTARFVSRDTHDQSVIFYSVPTDLSLYTVVALVTTASDYNVNLHHFCVIFHVAIFLTLDKKAYKVLKSTEFSSGVHPGFLDFLMLAVIKILNLYSFSCFRSNVICLIYFFNNVINQPCYQIV